MATITKCDKCNRTLKKEHVRISLNDTYGVAISRCFLEYLDLCTDCAKESIKILGKVFPKLLLRIK